MGCGHEWIFYVLEFVNDLVVWYHTIKLTSV